MPERQKWLAGGTITDTGIQYSQTEVMDTKDFYNDIEVWVDSYFENDGSGFKNIYKPGTMSDEEIEKIILYRLCVGWYNEIFIRDFCQMAIEIAPHDLKVHKALLRQVDDEHRHAVQIWNLLQKRGIDPREYGTTDEYRIFWGYLNGLCRRPHEFMNVFASTQLVVERLTAFKTIPQIVELTKDFDPEVCELYGEKIYKDEVFHTVELPEFIVKKHATTLDDQNRVRIGVERGFIMMDLIAGGVARNRDRYTIKK